MVAQDSEHENSADRSPGTLAPVSGEGRTIQPTPETDDCAPRVTPATPAQIEKIDSGLKGGFVLQRSAAWMERSSAHENAYYVVAYIDGPGVSDALGGRR